METGLNETQVLESRRLQGSNALDLAEDRVFLHTLKEVVTEPMFLLLLAACIVYLIAGQYREGSIMAISICIVAGISLFQEYRSRSAVHALNKLSAERARVLRSGSEISIPAEEIVVGDILLLEEGNLIAADGTLLEARDFSVNESILTGESFSSFKSTTQNSDCYKGTLVTSGNSRFKVSTVGGQTMFGKIGLSIRAINVVKTPLQVQIRSFVQYMVWIGAGACVLVGVMNYLRNGDLLHSFLQGLTLAMSILPEEIPVAFSTFQALGAFRLLKHHIIVKQPQYVETLGAATVICADKTGTITQNMMQIEFLFDWEQKTSLPVSETTGKNLRLIEYAMWSSESEPFDPMEKALHELYARTTAQDLRKQFHQIHEYPLSGSPPKMTHIFQDESGHIIIAAKGAPEAILQQSRLEKTERGSIEEQALNYARKGYRVLGVGMGKWEGNKWPSNQDDFEYEFLGLIAFQDPPKPNIKQTILRFAEAGINVKMITGDFPETAAAIAEQVGLDHENDILTGKDVIHLDKAELQKRCKNTSIFARMFPEAKLKVINALRENGEVVAMTGDGVNDAPALRAAHIGIAMGKKGSEVAKSAASLILTDDDLTHMIDAVELGRKIYDNLKKAIRYIVSIHIPIILIVTLPLLLKWRFENIFNPIHVIFLELIMGPTCSIIYENEPIEPGSMQRPPRKMSNTFLSWRQLSSSIIQGLMITVGCLGLGFYGMFQGMNESGIRTLIFMTLLFSNIFLTLINRSFSRSLFQTLTYRNWMVPFAMAITAALIICLLLIPYLQDLFLIRPIGLVNIGACIMAAFVCTYWMEVIKGIKIRGHLQ